MGSRVWQMMLWDGHGVTFTKEHTFYMNEGGGTLCYGEN